MIFLEQIILSVIHLRLLAAWLGAVSTLFYEYFLTRAHVQKPVVSSEYEKGLCGRLPL